MTKPTIHSKSLEDEMEDRKRLIAYQIWESEGRPDGKADEHWERACLVVMSLVEDPDAAAPDWLKRDSAVDTARSATVRDVGAGGKKAAAA